MENLLSSYKDNLSKAKRMIKEASNRDKSLLNGMIRDMQYAIEWMETGRQPGNKRGVERLAAYQRERPFDPLLMQRFFRSQDETYVWDESENESVISSAEQEMIDDALSVLTAKEKEVYLMSRGHCLSYNKIANYLCISSSSVQTMIERAEKKIAKRRYDSLFCLSS
ncbi:Fis family transcriptional regulator [[Bacillus] enclensis]|uniref:RNA polymerase sigma-70 factor, ECF subfamily n=1 Tax=[Bacillus] enclensis TaxID=1402860 RepID=A0A0V8HMP9_9BACI|nr:sigma factor-like helix-turn-helix DNA-binding protein [[Bacillus] enclensis]KSU63658.1 Fis family transcriptional regulator [[Bacillus] enclensis]SCB87641.1 RNA polymerase sigma-70 factor, ECF subfamily [[Bacillus] enclensis]